jgi:carboxypeptidase family protein/TonB-dependent receptor-like protein
MVLATELCNEVGNFISTWAKAPFETGKKVLRAVPFAALMAFLFSAPLLSQTSQGTIQGAIFDQSGGAIPGSTVIVIDVARGISRTLTTDSAGQYIASNLTPGMYTVRGEANGFQNTERANVLVEVGQTIRVDLTLQPGQQSQTITVTGELPEINTTDSTLGGTVSNTEILALPLNGRNFERLLNLRPGVYLMVAGHNPGGSSTETNGARFGTDMLTVEGLPAFTNTAGALTLGAEYRIGDAQSMVPVDAIQEFNTQQNPKAEYGWRPGSVINVGIKSGTNALHGSAFAFGRNASATDASNFFTPGQVTPATVEQFGGTAGGPILKDKLFWFVSYEGLRTTLTNPFVNTIPADVAMTPTNAAFSIVDACNAIGRGAVNQLSALLAGLPAGSCTPQPASSTFENLFPFTTNTSQTGNYAANLVTSGPLNTGLIKGDYALSQHHHLSGFYYISKAFQTTNYSNFQLLPQWTGSVPSTIEMYGGSWSWAPNSSWVNEVRAGYDYFFAQTYSGDRNLFTQGAWPNGYGFNSGVTAAENSLYGGQPNITINSFTGYLGAGQRTGIRGPDGEASFIDNVSLLRGKHSFKFGFQFMDMVYDNNDYSTANGVVKFTDLNSFLQGTPRSGTLKVGNPYEYVRAHWYSVFFQDDYRVSTRVTLNMGLRWEYQGDPVERNNYEATFDPSLAWPIPQVGGSGMPRMFNPYYKAISPRFGVAWDVHGNGKTVVRAGASLLREPQLVGPYVGVSPFGANVADLGINTSGSELNLHTPVALTIPGASVNWNANTLEPNATGSVFPVGQPISVQLPNGSVVSGLTGPTCLSPNDKVLSGVAPPACSTQGVNPNFVQAHMVEWNVDVQRAISNNLTVDVAYVGTHGGSQNDTIDVNQSPLGAGWDTSAVAACLSPASIAANYKNCTADPTQEVGSGVVCTACPYGTKYPFLTNIGILENKAFSNYNALQLTVNKRPTHGLAFLAAYTYAHSLDEGSGEGGGLSAIDAYNLRLNYGASDFDIRHRFTLSPTYTIPGIKSPGQMLQGWVVSGILSLYSGLPWYPSDATKDLLGTNEFNDAVGTGVQTWNYTGPRSAFTPEPTSFPCYANTGNKNSIKGCTSSALNAQAQQAWASCVGAATAPYGSNGQLQALALASLNNIGCYVTAKGGILTPPAFGTVGDASRNIFRAPNYSNVDFSVSKDWRLKERFDAQFRLEFFNVFNWVNLAIAGNLDPEGSKFGCACATPDVLGNNPVLGSGGPRHIQFGLKINW